MSVNTANLAGNAGEVLKKNVKDLLVSGLFSDLTIECRDKSFKVHKAILYTQSDYFKTLLGGKFRESKQNVIALDEDPDAFNALLFFFYNFAWTPSMVEPTETVAVYQLADKYDVPPLRQLAASRFKLACDPQHDVEGFVDGIEAVNESTAPNDETLWNIIIPMIKQRIDLLLTFQVFGALIENNMDLTFKLLGELSL